MMDESNKDGTGGQNVFDFLAGLALSDPEHADQYNAILKRHKNLEEGKAVSWKSTSIMRQNLRMTVKASVPSDMGIKELLEEIKKAEARMNVDTSIVFTIEFGD